MITRQHDLRLIAFALDRGRSNVVLLLQQDARLLQHLLNVAVGGHHQVPGENDVVDGELPDVEVVNHFDAIYV